MEKAKGWVYFIQAEHGDVKIGYAGNPHSRMADMQTANSRRLKLLGAVPGDMAMEKALHRRFDKIRLMGEWFKPEPELLHFIEGICYGHEAPCEGAAEPGVAFITRDQAETIAVYVRLRDLVGEAEELGSLLRGAKHLEPDELISVLRVEQELHLMVRNCGAVVEMFGKARVMEAHRALATVAEEHGHTVAEARLAEANAFGVDPMEYETRLVEEAMEREWPFWDETPAAEDLN